MAELSPEPLDAWHYFEIMDRSSVVADLFEYSIAEHPVVNDDAPLKELVEQVETLLGQIYHRASTLFDAKLDEYDDDGASD